MLGNTRLSGSLCCTMVLINAVMYCHHVATRLWTAEWAHRPAARKWLSPTGLWKWRPNMTISILSCRTSWRDRFGIGSLRNWICVGPLINRGRVGFLTNRIWMGSLIDKIWMGSLVNWIRVGSLIQWFTIRSLRNRFSIISLGSWLSSPLPGASASTAILWRGMIICRTRARCPFSLGASQILKLGIFTAGPSWFPSWGSGTSSPAASRSSGCICSVRIIWRHCWCWWISFAVL